MSISETEHQVFIYFSGSGLGIQTNKAKPNKERKTGELACSGEPISFSEIKCTVGQVVEPLWDSFDRSETCGLES